MNRELHMFKLDLEKAEELEINLPPSDESLKKKKKQESSKKYSTFLNWLRQSLWLCESQLTVDYS